MLLKAPEPKQPDSKPAAAAPAAPPVAVAPVAAEKPAAAKPAAEPAAAAKPAAETAKPQTAEKPAAAPASDAEVRAAVEAWAQAWRTQDIEDYLGAYSDKFTPADGTSLSKWKETRRQRIVGRGTITLTLRDIDTTVDNDRATVRFRQHYASGSLKTSTRKTLALQREKGVWRIVRESTGG
ncbi:hypothetical protein SDC9_171806 [bioreactor metagenome]|uniref:Cds6 C-terminal domain-containing protein n=1 Tax=bioreactor metagenome TaxID=1076179 RepID=A0A645GBW0_9ZZZZ